MPEGRDGKNYPDRRGPASPSWRGGRQVAGNGYVQVIGVDSANADSRGRVYEHVAVAERALGKSLPAGAVVHHIDDDRKNNDPANLVICQDQAYHQLLHYRRRAYRACGHANWHKCRYCKRWDSPESLRVWRNEKSGLRAQHPSCHAEAERIRQATGRER